MDNQLHIHCSFFYRSKYIEKKAYYTITVIGEKAFYGCKKLKSVEIKSKKLKKVGKKAFDKTSKKLKISISKKKLKSYKKVLKKAGVKAGNLKSTKI